MVVTGVKLGFGAEHLNLYILLPRIENGARQILDHEREHNFPLPIWEQRGVSQTAVVVCGLFPTLRRSLAKLLPLMKLVYVLKQCNVVQLVNE